MSDQKHNGWTNYETWLARTWLDNDAEIAECCRELTQSAIERATNKPRQLDFSLAENATLELADMLKEQTESNFDPYTQGRACLFTDLLWSALCEVNWHEIADKFVADELEQTTRHE